MHMSHVNTHTQATDVSKALYKWSWGALNITWRIIGPYKTTGEYTEEHCGQLLSDIPVVSPDGIDKPGGQADRSL